MHCMWRRVGFLRVADVGPVERHDVWGLQNVKSDCNRLLMRQSDLDNIKMLVNPNEKRTKCLIYGPRAEGLAWLPLASFSINGLSKVYMYTAYFISLLLFLLLSFCKQYIPLKHFMFVFDPFLFLFLFFLGHLKV